MSKYMKAVTHKEHERLHGMSKYTKGPWEVNGEVINSEHQNIARCNVNNSIANAQLISTAPELLEALKAAEVWHRGDKWRNGKASEHIAWREHRDMLKQAIARAEGRE